MSRSLGDESNDNLINTRIVFDEESGQYVAQIRQVHWFDDPGTIMDPYPDPPNNPGTFE